MELYKNIKGKIMAKNNKLEKALAKAIEEQKTKTHIADKLLKDLKSGKETDPHKIKDRICQDFNHINQQ